MLSIAAAVVVIAILIFVHELGHFAFAKLFHVKVLVFSLGFGPAVLKKRIGETEYRLSILPLGGYVKMLGEGESEEAEEQAPEEDASRSYANQANWKKLLILGAGPLSNWLFALLILWAVFISGVPSLTTKVGDVKNNSPAYLAGIRKGDTITAINGKRISGWAQMKKIIVSNPDKELSITLKRSSKTLGVELKLPFLELLKYARNGSKTLVVKLKPRITSEKNVFGELIKVPIIGIISAGDFVIKKDNPASAFVLAGAETWKISVLVVVSMVKLVEGDIPSKDLGGPILIAQQAAKMAKQGFAALMYFTALIGINFAILNILPIPVLDGGNIVFTLIEAAIRKPINKKVKLAILEFGVVFIILLTVFVFYNDISRIMTSHH